MKLLAFDTSTSFCTVGICCNNLISHMQQSAVMQHGKLLLPMVENILCDSTLELAELDAIAYGAGPGSFTGVRLACSTAQALAYAQNKPLIKLSSLQSLAQSAWLTKNWQHVLVVRDAKMGQVYFGIYRLHEDTMRLEGAEMNLTQCEIHQLLNHYLGRHEFPIYGIGDGLNLLSEKILNQFTDTDAMVIPSAEALLKLAKQQYEQGLLLTAQEAEPVYLP